MKLIDLLSKIANGEEIKAKLKFKLADIIITYYGTNNYYKTPEYNIEYIDKGCTTHDFNLGMIIKHLNDEVEILEEKKKITPTDFENLGYALGSIQKYINKGYDKAIEEKKIPEKLDLILDEHFTNDELQAYIYETQEKVNQLIDYLKSKGE